MNPYDPNHNHDGERHQEEEVEEINHVHPFNPSEPYNPCHHWGVPGYESYYDEYADELSCEEDEDDR